MPKGKQHLDEVYFNLKSSNGKLFNLDSLIDHIMDQSKAWIVGKILGLIQIWKRSSDEQYQNGDHI